MALVRIPRRRIVSSSIASGIMGLNTPGRSVLTRAWTGSSFSGNDIYSSVNSGLVSTTTYGATSRGPAITNTGGIAGTIRGMNRVIASYPYFQIGYGYFNTAGGAWILSQLLSSAGGTTSRLSLSSSTTVRLDLRYFFGIGRTLDVTLPTTLNTPICMVAQINSPTDYTLFANGLSNTGSSNPGVIASGFLDQMVALGDSLNGGIWFSGYGIGVIMPDQFWRELTRNPDTELWRLLALNDSFWYSGSGTLIRALMMSSGNIAQVPTASLGTGIKPLVIMSDGEIKERATVEGSPIVLDNGELRVISASETLEI